MEVTALCVKKLTCPGKTVKAQKQEDRNITPISFKGSLRQGVNDHGSKGERSSRQFCPAPTTVKSPRPSQMLLALRDVVAQAT